MDTASTRFFLILPSRFMDVYLWRTSKIMTAKVSGSHTEFKSVCIILSSNHPSIFCRRSSSSVSRVAGAYPGWLGERHSHSHSHLWKPIILLSACLCTVGGTHSTRRELMQTRGERKLHAKVLITAPPCCSSLIIIWTQISWYNYGQTCY